MKQFLLIISFLPASALAQNDSLPKIDTSSLFKTKKLDLVVIKSKKPFVEIQVDKTVLNVQADLVASGGTLFEVIQKAPGVSISNEETINLAGKAGVNVLIDGRPAQLNGKDLANYLKSTPASLVDKIEVIMNPSARYDAQGNAGIINIRLKKNIAKGTNGNISTSYTQAVHANMNLSTNLNYRKGKWNWFGNAAARKSRQNTQGAINRFVNSNGINKTFENKTVDEDHSANASFTAGADFYLNKKNSFGLIVKGNEYKSQLFTPGNTLIKTNNSTDSSLRTLNDNNQKNGRYTYNLNYKFEDTTGVELNVDADYISFKNNSNGLVTTDLLNNQSVKYGYTANDQDVLTGLTIYSLKTDFSKQFKKWQAKIETGLKYNTVQTSNDLEAFLWVNNQFKADTGRSNTFNYTENMYAGYASFNQKIKKWEYQAGLRVEQSIIKGTSTDLRNLQLNYPDTSYFNLFPTTFIRYAATASNSIGLSYGRRINRPSFQDLNPFEYIYDNYSRERGNPYLLPEFSNNFELSYSYKGSLNISLGHSRTNNLFQLITTQKGEATEATNFNVGKEYRFYVNASLGLPVKKWWYSYTNVSPFHKQFSGVVPEGRLDNKAWGMSWYTSHNFSLSKNYTLQLSSWGNIATEDAMSKTAWLGSVDLAAGKSLAKKKLEVRISVTDIFNTQRWRQDVNFGRVHYNYQRKWESRNFRLQLSWKLGKTNFKERQRASGAETETIRIK